MVSLWSSQAFLARLTDCKDKMYVPWLGHGGLVNATGDIVGNKYKVLHQVCILLAIYWWPWQCSDQSNPQQVFGEANVTRWQLATSSSHSPTSEGTHTFPSSWSFAGDHLLVSRPEWLNVSSKTMTTCFTGFYQTAASNMGHLIKPNTSWSLIFKDYSCSLHSSPIYIP